MPGLPALAQLGAAAAVSCPGRRPSLVRGLFVIILPFLLLKTSLLAAAVTLRGRPSSFGLILFLANLLLEDGHDLLGITCIEGLVPHIHGGGPISLFKVEYRHEVAMRDV